MLKEVVNASVVWKSRCRGGGGVVIVMSEAASLSGVGLNSLLTTLFHIIKASFW